MRPVKGAPKAANHSTKTKKLAVGLKEKICKKPSLQAAANQASHTATLHKCRHLVTHFRRQLRVKATFSQGLRLFLSDMAQQVFHTGDRTAIHRKLAET